MKKILKRTGFCLLTAIGIPFLILFGFGAALWAVVLLIWRAIMDFVDSLNY